MTNRMQYVTGAVLGLTMFGLVWAADARSDTPLEDEPGWSCIWNGNHVCGPNNDEGAYPGRYENGLLVEEYIVVSNVHATA